MLIYFLRHGDASSHSRFHDNERPLTDLGHKQAAYVGKFLLQTKTHINIILTSPLTRACETGAIVQSLINAPRMETSECLVNGTHPKQLFKQITEIEMKKCSLALVEVLEPLRPGTGILKQLIHVETISKFIKP
jgi:uncharacterized phosphatase